MMEKFLLVTMRELVVAAERMAARAMIGDMFARVACSLLFYEFEWHS